MTPEKPRVASTSPDAFDVPDYARPVPGKWRYLVPDTAPPGSAWEDSRGQVYFVPANREGRPCGVRKVPEDKLVMLEIQGVPLFRPFKRESAHGVRYFDGPGRSPNGKPNTSHITKEKLSQIADLLLRS